MADARIGPVAVSQLAPVQAAARHCSQRAMSRALVPVSGGRVCSLPYSAEVEGLLAGGMSSARDALVLAGPTLTTTTLRLAGILLQMTGEVRG